MKPVNEKSLLAHLFDQMDKLDKGETTESAVIAQCKLCNEATKLFTNELKRTQLAMQCDVHAKEYGVRHELRELSSKGFEDTTNAIDRTEY